ncbi:MAG: DUF2828 family protein, partial [Nostocales cyanobacterium W4_Combined_metabat2_030]|nr:DUF2828 family protein [Nostocales cyanobacterium W4_Combined_metabat2_030]
MLNSIKNDLKQTQTKITNATPAKTFAQAAIQDINTPRITQTANGNIAFSTAGTAIIDFFFQGGAMRNWSPEAKRTAFSKAYAEDKLLALKLLFYFRDIRGGQGERDLFRQIITDLVRYDASAVRKNIHLFSEYGRWDDLFVLLGTSVEADVMQLIATQLEADWKDEFPSLLAKWMKSENASSKQSRLMAKKLATGLGLTPKEYRQMLSKLRSQINIVETKISNGEYDKIDYSSIPSNAAMKYRKAFFRHDEIRYKAYLDALSKPVEERTPEFRDVKVNAKTLYPHEIAGKILDSVRGYGSKDVSNQDIQLFEAQWKALPDYFDGKTENQLVIADVSGSMNGTPMNVAVSLAIYAAERNTGKFNNVWMNFSTRPSLQYLMGETLYQKIRSLNFSDWAMSTNVNAALQLVLDTGLRNKLPQDEMPSKLIIVSDMQFDQCVENSRDGGLFNTIEKKFLEAGYDMPQIVFWNVNATAKTAPTFSKQGVALVSGFS